MSVDKETSNPKSLSVSDIAFLEKHNIRSKEVVYFLVEDFQYTNIQDAIAAAKRRDNAANES